jgi:photosystem II stability/assembly factor-like uncharacterized protein
MNTLRVAMLVSVVLALLCGFVPAQEKKFEVLGIGGAGGMYTPMASPFDPDLMFISCDMSGTYRSTDGGKRWSVIDYHQINSSLGCYPYFVKDAILWVSGSAVKISRDKGATWQSASPEPLPWKSPVKRLAAVDPGQGKDLIIFAGTKEEMWRSADGGKTYEKALDGDCFAILPLGTKVFASAGAPQVSEDEGKTWRKLDVPELKGKTFMALAGAKDANGSVLIGSAFGIGVLRSTDEGKTWGLVVDKYDDQNVMFMPANQTKVAYAAQSGGSWCRKVWKTSDGGATWQECFFMIANAKNNVQPSWVQTALRWDYYITPNGLGYCPSDPNLVLLSTQGDFYISRDGAKTWQQDMNIPVEVTEDGQKVQGYQCNGLEVTAAQDYFFDPFDANRTYASYHDIGFTRSPDRGKTWIPSTRGSPWGNTFYHVVFDPQVKGRMYAAASNRHDIPHWLHISPNTPKQAGGVVVSDDHGRNWKVLGTGLPAVPCTYVCIDPKSPKTLYATMYEGGVYKSTDGGQTWVNKSNGLGNPGNLHVLMVKVHPKSGDLFCSITAMREGARDFRVPGGLWKSSDGGETWTDLTKDLKLLWANSFAFDPNDPNTIYLTAATSPAAAQGGIYKTIDGGKTWQKLMGDADFAKSGPPGYVHAEFINLHPDKPDHVYVGTETHGLWMSPDAGKTWKKFENIPFKPVTNVTFDPKDTSVMYVCTYGCGVWRGNYLP